MDTIKEKIKNGVELYQCPGCIGGHDTTCYKKSGNSVACGEHRAGTLILPGGKVFLGMPKGFNRLGVGFGDEKNLKIEMFESFEQADWYNEFNIPVWKHIDENGNTLVRGLSPRTNQPFLHIYLEDCMDKIDCYVVSHEMIEKMD